MGVTTTILEKNSSTKSVKEEIIEFYNKTTEDYGFWSKDLNMHFGYYIPFRTNFLKRDTMLNQMNSYLFSLLDIENKKSHIVDLGCGVGATMKYGILKYPKLAVTGCSISEFQVKFGNEFVNSERGSILNKDYRDTKFTNNAFDGAMAIESFCHSGCSLETLKEAYRILKPGSKLVVADAFSKKGKSEMNLFSKQVYMGLCKSWSLEGIADINEVKKQLIDIGFKDVKVKNIWYRVAPSVLHVPFAISGFILRKLMRNKPLEKDSINNLKGSFYALLTSLCMQDFGYYIIIAKK